MNLNETLIKTNELLSFQIDYHFMGPFNLLENFNRQPDPNNYIQYEILNNRLITNKVVWRITRFIYFYLKFMLIEDGFVRHVIFLNDFFQQFDFGFVFV